MRLRRGCTAMGDHAEDVHAILRSGVDERRTHFETVAAHLETRAQNIEKDLYVRWVLDILFNRRILRFGALAGARRPSLRSC